MQEAGATADIELGYTLADGLEYLRTGTQHGLTIDQFAPRLILFLRQWENVLHGNCKNACWSYALGKNCKFFHPKKTKSMALRTHSQTSGWSLTNKTHSIILLVLVLKRWQQLLVILNPCIQMHLMKRLHFQLISLLVSHVIHSFIFKMKQKYVKLLTLGAVLIM